jgi:hypothetical protein
MPVEITILSGSRQGERLTLNASAFTAGDLAIDAIAFPSTDNVSGRRVAFRRDSEGWRLENLGAPPVLVNHQAVRRATRLRSGDVVRMSPTGPEISFRIVGEPSSPAPAAAPLQSGGRPPALTADAPREPSPSLADRLAALAAHCARPPLIAALVALLASFAISLSALLVWDESSVAAPVPLRLPRIADQSIVAGETLELSLAAIEGATPRRPLRYRLEGEAPAGVRLNAETGALTWRTQADQAPAAYRLTVVAETKETPPARAAAAFTVRVVAAARPPTVAPIADQVIDVRHATPFKLLVTAIHDDPATPLRFALAGKPPQGLRIDSESGLMTWTPDPKLAGATFTVRVRAYPADAPHLAAEREFQLRVIPSDPWKAVAERIGESLFLLVAKDSRQQRVFPVCAVCAVGTRELMTSGGLAHALGGQKTGDLQLAAVSLTTGEEFRVVEIKLPKYFTQLANEPKDQRYFDLALLTVDRDLPRACPLAKSEWIDQLSAANSLRCVIFPLTKDWPARLSTATLQLVPATPLRVTRLSRGLEQAPRLLRIEMTPPAPAFGCPIVNERGELVAIYSRPATDARDADEHEATWTLNAELVQDRRTGFWRPLGAEGKATATN